MSLHQDPGRRHEFIYLFDVKDGNPNGDPDAGNMPRVDPETMHGLVTDVALKRKVRDYVAAVHGLEIFIQSREALNALIYKGFRDEGVEPPTVTVDPEVAEWVANLNHRNFEVVSNEVRYSGEETSKNRIQAELLEGFEDVKEEIDGALLKKIKKMCAELAKATESKGAIDRATREKVRENLCRRYYDIRMFGAVLSTGLNAGQVRGPMQLTFARSVDPILQLELTITRQARTTQERMETGPTEMGRKYIVPYGLYIAHGFYSPILGAQTGVTQRDLGLFWDALLNMFDFDRSAARGEMTCRGLYIFTHENERGNAPAHQLFKCVSVTRRHGVETPRAFSDYEITVGEKDIPAGVHLTRLG